MHRPIGVTILAVLAGLAGLFEIWRALVFVGAVSFSFVGKTVTFTEPQWGPAFWAVLIALIWFWVAAGFWNVRAYAWSFGNFIAIFTIIFGFFALLGGQGRWSRRPSAGSSPSRSSSTSTTRASATSSWSTSFRS